MERSPEGMKSSHRKTGKSRMPRQTPLHLLTRLLLLSSVDAKQHSSLTSDPTNQIPSRLLSSTSFARLPLGCAVRRSASLALARYRRAISLVIVVILSFAYARNSIQTRRADTARVPSLVSTTLDRLATQAALYTRGDASEAWISVGQLRDDILRDIFSDSRRERVWARVRDIIEKNANVRASVREGRAGDVSRVWEWIGNIGFLEESYYEGSRRSSGKRVSFGITEERDALVNQGVSTTPQGGGESEKKEMVERRKWDEGRSIF